MYLTVKRVKRRRLIEPNSFGEKNLKVLLDSYLPYLYIGG
jgi:hypothetical protein